MLFLQDILQRDSVILCVETPVPTSYITYHLCTSYFTWKICPLFLLFLFYTGMAH